MERTAVTYENRYGISLSGDLYRAKDLGETRDYPAIVIGSSYGGVKEQGPGVCANELAKRGFVVLAFDPSFNGESGGEPRHVSSPDIFTEDFSAGVDYLGMLEYVDRERIGAVGICGSGGFALAAAQVDARIQAVATASLFDVSVSGEGLDREQWAETRPISEAAYEAVTGQKELWIIPEANHVDLYDDENKIPFDRLAEFFQKNM